MLDPTLILIGKIEIFLAVTESNGIRGGSICFTGGKIPAVIKKRTQST